MYSGGWLFVNRSGNAEFFVFFARSPRLQAIAQNPSVQLNSHETTKITFWCGTFNVHIFPRDWFRCLWLCVGCPGNVGRSVICRHDTRRASNTYTLSGECLFVCLLQTFALFFKILHKINEMKPRIKHSRAATLWYIPAQCHEKTEEHRMSYSLKKCSKLSLM